MLKFDQDRLLLALKEQGELDFKQIGQLLRVKPSEHANLGSWLNQLLSRGSIYLSQSSRCYSLAKRIDEIEGEIRVNEKNFAFVNPGEERDRERAVFIGPKHFNGALNGDTVLVDVFKTVAQQERIFGIVREVKKRATNRLVLIVTFSEWLNKTILKPLDSRLKGNFQLAGLEALRLNEVVVARIKDFNRGIFHLELERIIGDLNQGNNDIKALLEHYEIPSS